MSSMSDNDKQISLVDTPTENNVETTSNPNKQHIYTDAELFNMLNKYRILNRPITEIPAVHLPIEIGTTNKHFMYLVKVNADKLQLIIPSDVTHPYPPDKLDAYIDDSVTALHLLSIMDGDNEPLLDCFKDVKNKTIELIGGADLRSLNYLFQYVNTENCSIDLTRCDISKVESMCSTFLGADAYKIKFGNFKTPRLTTMKETFTECRVCQIDFGGITTRNVINTSGMFEHAFIAEGLDLSKLDTENVVDASGMFSGAKIPELNLGDNFLPNVKDVQQCFSSLCTKNLELGNFTGAHVHNAFGMFSGIRLYRAEVLDLTRVYFPRTARLTAIFDNIYYYKGGKPRILVSDPRLREEYSKGV